MTTPTALALDESVARLFGQALKLEDFSEFGAEHARKLFPRSGLFGYPADFVLVRQGEHGRDLFLVCDGRLGVRQQRAGASVNLATLGTGSLLGEIALLQGVPRTATVTALVDSKVYRLLREDLHYILANNPALATHLRALISQRLRL